MPKVCVGRTRSRGVEFSSADIINYSKFIDEYPRTMLSSETWLKVITRFNELFREYLLQTGEREKIPFGMGSVVVSKKKTIASTMINGVEVSLLPIDWVKSKEVGRRMRIMNTHSDGFRFKWTYFKNESTMRQRDLWCFKPTRETSLMITKYVKDENGAEYMEKWKQWGKHVV